MKCHGDNCPQRSLCERFTAEESKVQAWLSVSPYDDNSGECSMFVPCSSLVEVEPEPEVPLDEFLEEDEEPDAG